MRKLKYVKLFENFQVNEGLFNKELYSYDPNSKDKMDSKKIDYFLTDLKEKIKNQIKDRKITSTSIKNSDLFEKNKILFSNLGIRDFSDMNRTKDMGTLVYSIDPNNFYIISINKSKDGLLVGGVGEEVTFILVENSVSEKKHIIQINKKEYREIIYLHENSSLPEIIKK